MDSLRHIFGLPAKLPVWLQQGDGIIKFPRNGCFLQLVAGHTYTLMSRVREEVVDLTLTSSDRSSDPQAPSTKVTPRHEGTPLDVGSSSQAPTDPYCYICCEPAQKPVRCLYCGNVMGCMKDVLQLARYNDKCPICKEESILSSTIATVENSWIPEPWPYTCTLVMMFQSAGNPRPLICK